MTRRIAPIAVLVLALGAASAGVALAAGGGGGGDDQPLTGSTLDSATKAALAHTGGGTVTETEIGDDGAAYGVEVRLPDGRQFEVSLDGSFAVIGRELDEDIAGEQNGSSGD